jgi:hypothetical protein
LSDITQRLSTALAGRYRIERELGAGGMATVYLARIGTPSARRDKSASPGTGGDHRYRAVPAEIRIAAKLTHGIGLDFRYPPPLYDLREIPCQKLFLLTYLLVRSTPKRS